MQALVPPRKLNMFPQTPGTLFPPGISLNHLSGLYQQMRGRVSEGVPDSNVLRVALLT